MSRWLSKLKLPLIASLLLSLGLYFFYMLGQVDTLHCERVSSGQPAATCTMKTTWMNLVTLRKQNLGRLLQAGIQDSCDSEGCTYRVYLETDRGGTALGVLYTSDLRSQQATAEKINQFLADSDAPALDLSTGAVWILIIPALILLAGAVVAVIGIRALLHPTE